MTARPARGMLDTSAVVRLGDVADPASLPVECVVSAVTLAELSVGPLVTADPHERAVRQQHVQLTEASLGLVPFDAAAARAFGAVAAALRADGRTVRARAYDALIAASALAEGIPLYTANPRDFTGIPGLDVRVPTYPPS
ncbi:MAG TPA: PIN domain-containing protein [Microbacterium sp.]|nr:PIN domain-containing protein [Microbacterium sp.]